MPRGRGYRGRSQLGGRQLKDSYTRAIGPGPGRHSSSYRGARRIQNSFTGTSGRYSYAGRRYLGGKLYKATMSHTWRGRATVVGARFGTRKASLLISHRGASHLSRRITGGARRTGSFARRNVGGAAYAAYLGGSIFLATSSALRNRSHKKSSRSRSQISKGKVTVARRNVPARRGRSELGGRAGRATVSHRPGYAVARVYHTRNISRMRAVQTYNKAGGIAPRGYRAPRKVVTTVVNNRRTGRNATAITIVTGRGLASTYRRATFVSRPGGQAKGRGIGQRTAALGAYHATAIRPSRRAALGRQIKSAGYRRSGVRSAISGQPVYVERRVRRKVRPRRDSRGRWAGSYAG